MTNKKSLGVFGFYLAILSLVFLCLGVLSFIFLGVAHLLTLGFLAAFLSQFFQTVNDLMFLSRVIAIISAPFLIIGFIQHKRNALYAGYRKTISGIIIAGVIFLLFIFSNIFGTKPDEFDRVYSDKKLQNFRPYYKDNDAHLVAVRISYSTRDRAIYLILANYRSDGSLRGQLLDRGESIYFRSLEKVPQGCEPPRVEYYLIETKKKVVVNSSQLNFELEDGKAVLLKIFWDGKAKGRFDDKFVFIIDTGLNKKTTFDVGFDAYIE